DFTARDMHVDPTPRSDFERSLLAFVEQSGVHARILMNTHRSVLAVLRGNQAQPAPLLLRREALLLVLRLDAEHVRLDTDLQEVHDLRLGVIELAMPHAAPRAHALDV